MSVIDTTAEITLESKTLESKTLESKTQTVGQRLMLTFDCIKPFTHKGEDGTETQLQRVYHFNVPYMSPFEEIYTVIDEFKAEVQKQEKLNKENTARIAAEKAAKDKEEAVIESSHN